MSGLNWIEMSVSFTDVLCDRERIQEYDEAWKGWTEDDEGMLMLMHGQVIATK